MNYGFECPIEKVINFDEFILDFSESITSASTHMNSSIDRSQFLLELFSAEVEFQYAKMDVNIIYNFLASECIYGDLRK